MQYNHQHQTILLTSTSNHNKHSVSRLDYYSFTSLAGIDWPFKEMRTKLHPHQLIDMQHAAQFRYILHPHCAGNPLIPHNWRRRAFVHSLTAGPIFRKRSACPIGRILCGYLLNEMRITFAHFWRMDRAPFACASRFVMARNRMHLMVG